MEIWVVGGIVLSVAAWQDTTDHTVSNYSVALLFACGIATALQHGSWLSAIAGMTVCGLPVLIVSLLVRHGHVGGGDVKLCGALGFFLGPWGGSIVILAALIFLSVFGLVRHKERQPIPFAPFIFWAYLISSFLLL